MASIVNYTPTGVIEKALFNFDPYGHANFKLSGLITISVSDSFRYADLLSGVTTSNIAWTSNPEYSWSSIQVNDIKAIASIYSSFANLSFSSVTNYDYTSTSSLARPSDVGLSSNINISIINRPDIANLLGASGAGWSGVFGYVGDAGDIVLNIASSILFKDYSFAETSKLAQVLMHEMGHSLGLAHPHSGYLSNGVAILTADFSQTQYVGFSQLGFVINSAADMNKEFFTIMSYDDENSAVSYLNAYTPMILDVIALQSAYGEGAGTSGSGNDKITAGTVGYRTFFDTGGIDTVDLSNYITGAYFNMGVSITGASHLVGLVVNSADATKLFAGGSPTSLRWFYGEYENALGSNGSDLIVGNAFNNTINGGSGDDTLYGGAGNDTFDWDVNSRAGNDSFYGGTGDDVYVLNSVSDVVNELVNEGTDTIWAEFSYSLASVANVEKLSLFGAGNINAVGNALNNTLSGNSGNNLIDGGAGFDVAVFTGTVATHTITIGASTTVTDKTANRDGTDTLTSIERLQFSDFNVALDVQGGQNAGTAYRMYKAALNRAPDEKGLGDWINVLDKGGDKFTALAAGFTGSGEFQAKYGLNLSTTDFVKLLYNNVLGRAPDANGLKAWVDAIDKNGGTREQALYGFSESTENINYSLTLIGNGAKYTEHVG